MIGFTNLSLSLYGRGYADLARQRLVEVGEGVRHHTPSLRLASLLRRQAKSILSRKGKEEIPPCK